MTPEHLLRLREIAARYRVCPTTFAAWVKAYGLPCVRVNSRVVRFDLAAVDEALGRRGRAPVAIAGEGARRGSET